MAHQYLAFMAHARHPSVRDLAWVIGSPTLLDPESPEFAGKAIHDQWYEQQWDGFVSQLVTLEADPTPLTSWIQSRQSQSQSQRLGRYFESLVSYWLHHAPGFSSVIESLKVKKGKITVGEFDFIYRDDSLKEHVHVEVAVKFYLRRGSGESWEHYLGPEGKEGMEQKLRLLFNKQLLLSETVEGLEALQERAVAKPITPFAMMKGIIFDPLEISGAFPAYPTPGLSSRRLRGWWANPERLAAWVQSRTSSVWSLVPKLQWLAPYRGPLADQVLVGETLVETLTELFKTTTTPQRVTEIIKSGSNGEYQEVSRGFVVG